MTWTPLTSPVDHVLLAGQRSPGIADVQGAGSPRRWDIRRGYALSGARPVFRGMDVARFRVVLRLLTEADWEAWHEWKVLVQQPPTGTRPRALDIWHPVLEECGISSAVVENVEQPVHDGTGLWTIAIAFIEFRPPQPLVIRTEGSSAVRPLSGTQLEIRIAELEGEVLEGQLGRELDRAAGRFPG